MAKCPNCGKDVAPRKSWSYWVFNVDDYSCDCGARFREYSRNGKHAFTLKLTNGRWKRI